MPANGTVKFDVNDDKYGTTEGTYGSVQIVSPTQRDFVIDAYRLRYTTSGSLDFSVPTAVQ